VGLIVLDEPLVRAIYERGSFASSNTLPTALALCAYSIGLWPISCQSILVRAYLVPVHKPEISSRGGISLPSFSLAERSLRGFRHFLLLLVCLSAHDQEKNASKIRAKIHHPLELLPKRKEEEPTM
jgi:hypothetical protein